MNKQEREEIRNMFGGRCAYCGKLLGKVFHTDHVKPLYRGREMPPTRAGKDEKENMFPSCPRCNNRKNVLTIDGFREEIKQQSARLRRDSSAYRLAVDFGVIKETNEPVIFWFEQQGLVQG